MKIRLPGELQSCPVIGIPVSLGPSHTCLPRCYKGAVSDDYFLSPGEEGRGKKTYPGFADIDDDTVKDIPVMLMREGVFRYRGGKIAPVSSFIHEYHSHYSFSAAVELHPPESLYTIAIKIFNIIHSSEPQKTQIPEIQYPRQRGRFTSLLYPGKKTVNSAPSFTLLATVISPPMISASSFAMASPSPSPRVPGCSDL